MKKLLILALLLASCSTGPSTTRTVATSAPKEMKRNIASLGDTEFGVGNESSRMIREKMQKLEQAYYRAEASLQELDRQIAAAAKENKRGVLFQSPAYAELMALWHVKEQLQMELTAEYVKTLKDANHTDQKIAKEARKTIQAVHETLDVLPAVERVALQDSLEHLKEGLFALSEGSESAFSMYGSVTGADGSTLSPSDIDAETLSLEAQKVNNHTFSHEQWADAKAQGKAELETKVNQVKSDDTFREEIDAFQASWQAKETPERNPNATMVFKPSTGPEGNMTGRTFPPNTWALTFDDGPHPVYTKVLLGTLAENKVPANFFCLAQQVVALKPITALQLKAGMLLGNHSFSHANLAKATPQELNHEINEANAVETKIYGKPIKFFRLPYGSGMKNQDIRARIAKLGLIHVFWNVDSLDWQDKDPSSVFARVRAEMKAEKGGIILFHDIHPQSIEAAKKLILYSNTLKDTPNKIRWVFINQMTGQ